MINFNEAKKIVDGQTIFWFRRDLRIKDNAGLYQALKQHNNVVPLFIFDTEILDKLEEKSDRRIDFIYQTLQTLKAEIEEAGSSLLVLYGNPVKVFEQLSPSAVYTNHDYEPYARQRDEAVKKILNKKGVSFSTFKDQVIFDKSEVTKDDGSPYTVFTPYSKKWKATLSNFFIKRYPTEKYLDNLKGISPLPFPALHEIGFPPSDLIYPKRVIATSIIAQYEKQRDIPSIAGTTRLSVHLRFGTVSIRQLVAIALKKNNTWLNELIWREFYQMILWHFPGVDKCFKAGYDNIEWRNNPDEFTAWCKGLTGYPIVDAGMRELNETGFMHNRVRMVTASFLTKHLLIDWRWGEAYFAKKLLDFDLAANNGGWQWAAGCGCDAAPYFRIFNPALQAKRFDPQQRYIKRWVPEFGTPAYPAPLVDHKMARERVLKVYQKALNSRVPLGV